MLWNGLRFGFRYRDRGCVDRPGTRLDEQIAPAGVPPIVAILENTTFFLPEPFAEQFVDLLQDRALRRAVHLFDGIREQVEVVSQRGHVGFRLRRSEEHTSELQSLMRISYAVFCLKKKLE